MIKSKSAKDLADSLCAEFTRRKVEPPAANNVITKLFEAMYFASLKTEESQQITFHIVYLDPQNPDPKPPRRITKDRWSYVAFKEHIEINIQNLVKIAKASDHRSSSLAVYSDGRGKLFIWGLIDQQNLYHKFVNHDSDRGPERPGVFQASINGVGHLSTYIKYEKVAELKINTITRGSIDVFRKGPITKALKTGYQDYLLDIQNYSKTQKFPEGLVEDKVFIDKWITTVCRLILRIQGFKHGGTILITPDRELSGLNFKYALDYSRLKTSLQTHAESYLRQSLAWDEIVEIYKAGKKQMSVRLHNQLSVAENNLEENNNEIEGALWFVSLLSRVDGAIILDNKLEVKGFGAEITYDEPPQKVYKSRTSIAKQDNVSEVDYNHFGTRHRSAMRYCSKVPGSVGIVISQDGDVRVFLSHQDQLLMWENIKLQYYEVIPKKVRISV